MEMTMRILTFGALIGVTLISLACGGFGDPYVPLTHAPELTLEGIELRELLERATDLAVEESTLIKHGNPSLETFTIANDPFGLGDNPNVLMSYTQCPDGFAEYLEGYLNLRSTHREEVLRPLEDRYINPSPISFKSVYTYRHAAFWGRLSVDDRGDCGLWLERCQHGGCDD